MGITVQQTLKINALREAKVLAGHQGLNNLVSFVNIMEVPNVTKWMKGGELLVSAGFAFKDNGEGRRRLIYDLAAKGVAAFGIKPGQYFESIPDDMVQYANEVGLPLIELPRDVPYMDFMVPIFEILLDEQLAKLKRVEQIHNRLLEIVLKGEGLLSVANTLVELAGNPVLILDAAGLLLVKAWPLEDEGTIVGINSEELLANITREKTMLFSLKPYQQRRFDIKTDSYEQHLMAIRIDVNNSLSGFLVIPEIRRVLDSQDLMAIEHTATIVALEFLKQRIVYETERQIRVDLLEDIISGNFRSEEDVIHRAARLGFDISDRTAIFVIQFAMAAEKGHDANLEHQQKNELFKLIQKLSDAYLGGAMLLIKSDSIVGLMKIPSSGDMTPLGKAMSKMKVKAIDKFPKLKMSVGIGCSAGDVSQIRKSYKEALDALCIANLMYESNTIMFFEGLGAFPFLFELEQSSNMRCFFERIIGKVIQYDRKNNSELIKTLTYYFKYDCNLRVTSERMYIHKNTVLYRIRKVEELTDLKLTNPEHRFNLQLALKVSLVFKSAGKKLEGHS